MLPNGNHSLVSFVKSRRPSGKLMPPRNSFSCKVSWFHIVASSVLSFITSRGILYSNWIAKKLNNYKLIYCNVLIYYNVYFTHYIFIYFLKQSTLHLTIFIYHFHKRRMTILLHHFCFSFCHFPRVGFKIYFHVCIRFLSVSHFRESSSVANHDRQGAASVMKRQFDLAILHIISDSLFGPPVSN